MSLMRAPRGMWLAMTATGLTALTACSFRTYLVVVNNSDEPVAVSWQLVTPAGGGCELPQTITLGTNWAGGLTFSPKARLHVETVSSADGRHGCRAVVPSRSAMVLAEGRNGSYDGGSTVPLTRLEISPGPTFATQAEATAAVRPFDDVAEGYLVGEPLPPEPSSWYLPVVGILVLGGAALWFVTPIVLMAVALRRHRSTAA